MNAYTRSTVVALVIVSLLGAGCPFARNTMSIRLEAHQLTWPDLNLSASGGGTCVGFEVAPGDNSQPAMGPFYLGGAYTLTILDDDSNLHRLGVRARSSMLDHPSNPRHPTYWMARGYGYLAACPLGKHTFDNEPPGSGDMTIPADGSKTFRYRLVFHDGTPKDAGIEDIWKQYAK